MGQLVSVFRRLHVQAPPAWGIEPVPRGKRILRGFDLFALWASLGVGLLVLQAGALLVPGLSFRAAMAAIVIGTLIGALLLSLTGLMGSRTGAPTMVLLRPVLGHRGSYLPTLVNVAQLVGWSAFELWVIALAASRISQSLFGAAHYGLWLALVTVFCLFLALGGPLVVVREWLEKFGIWVMALAALWLTVYLLGSDQAAQALARPGNGGLPFWLAVDLVVAMPISWLPLVADYSRFARHAPGAFWGTYAGTAVANIWFYGLGALFVLGLNMSESSPDSLALAIMAMTGGVLALVVILVDETDNVFADIYSSAVSLQNIFPHLSQRWLIVGITAAGAAMAAVLTMSQFYDFLLLTGSLFVPLFGVLAADYFVLRRGRYTMGDLYGADGRSGAQASVYASGYVSGFNPPALGAWIAGIAVYQGVAHGLPTLGASLPAFVVAFGAHLLFGRARQRSVAMGKR